MAAWKNKSYSPFLLLLPYSGTSNDWMVFQHMKALALSRSCATASIVNLNFFYTWRPTLPICVYAPSFRGRRRKRQKRNAGSMRHARYWLATVLPSQKQSASRCDIDQTIHRLGRSQGWRSSANSAHRKTISALSAVSKQILSNKCWRMLNQCWQISILIYSVQH